MTTGQIHVYTGNGKGKTTAAIGLAVRAAGAGKKSLIIQFMKEYPYSEKKSLNYLHEFITLEQYGGDKFVYEKRLPYENEKTAISSGLIRAEKAFHDGALDLVILDEIFVAVYFKVFSEYDVLELLNKRNNRQEIILTGRYAGDNIIELADLVTEMKEVKHYYQKGILSRKGFDS